MIGIIRALKKKGVLSINARNADYILPNNKRELYPIVDDKLKTKKRALQAGIGVPELYGTIEQEQQNAHLESILGELNSFVIKPAMGAGGNGILVIKDRLKGRFRKVNDKLLTLDDLRYHLSAILAGAYSLCGHPDVALIEYMVQSSDVFSEVSYQGVPDLRLIVFHGYPAMAMARLPTHQSEGKANLHQGAIGVGIDIKTGVTYGGVQGNHFIEQHPDTLNDLADIQIPQWKKILNIAASCYELTGLGYLGVDLVLDKEKGPLMLELNARPGLNIQIANRQGLLERYKKVEAHVKNLSKAQSIAQRLKFVESY